MENILSQRLVKFWVAGLLVLVSASLFILFLAPSPSMDEEGMQRFYHDLRNRIQERIDDRTEMIDAKIREISRYLEAGRIDERRFEEEEALIHVREGVIDHYHGAVYHYKILECPVNGGYLIRKRDRIFSVRRIRPRWYYIHFLAEIKELKEGFHYLPYRYAVKIGFLKNPPGPGDLKERFEPVARGEDVVYFFQSLLRHTHRQLLFQMELSADQLREHRVGKRRRSLLILSAALLLLLVTASVYRSRAGRSPRNLYLTGLLFFTLLLVLWVLIPMIDRESLFMSVPGGHLKSIYRVLLVGVGLFIPGRLFLKRFSIPFILHLSLVCGMVAALHPLVRWILDCYLLPFYRFQLSLPYLPLIATLFFFYLFLFEWIRRLPRERGKALAAGIVILVFAVLLLLVLDYSPVYLGSVLGLFFLSMTGERISVSREVLAVVLIGLSIFSHTMLESRQEKHRYISRSLNRFFLSQNNYAKFIVRSIISAIKSSDIEYAGFFQPHRTVALEQIWQSTLAAMENVPSGIYIVSRDGEMVNRYFYQMDYYEKEDMLEFPFWVIEERRVIDNNRRITYAMGSIQVVKDGVYLGDIIIQVINSPELILRYKEEDNIFTVHRKIRSQNISYIKFDDNGNVVENPENIQWTLQEGMREGWLDFISGNRRYTGYFFHNKDDRIVVYYPRENVFTHLAHYIKIVIFLFLLYYLFHMRLVRRWDIRTLYYSFSIRVFFILILLSLFTAGIFSLFSVNFTSGLIDKNFRDELLKKGRIAQNIAFDMLDREGEITRGIVFELSSIMNQAVSVYRDHSLLFASNNKMIIHNEIPVYIHSRVLEELEKNNDKVILLEEKNRLNLLFQVEDHIFSALVRLDRSDIYFQRKQYLDFIISLVFILGIMGGTAAVLFRRKILMPIHDLNQGMSEVEKGNLVSLPEIPNEVDLKSLYQRYNAMVSGIRDQRQKISEMSKLKTLIRLGRRVAHEVKNPLTPIKLSAEQIQQLITDKNPGYEAGIKKSVRYIVDESEHLRKVSYGFLNLSRIDELNRAWMDVSAFFQEQYLKFNQTYRKIRFGFEDRVKGRRVHWDRVKIEEILNNFVSNSIDAIPPDRPGRIDMVLSPAGEEELEFEIRDNGEGIPSEDLQDIFGENFTRKELGSGLGLFIARRIVEMHGGTIEIDSRRNRGTTVRVRLPVRC